MKNLKKHLDLIIIGSLFLFVVSIYISFTAGEKNSKITRVVYYQCDKDHSVNLEGCPFCKK